MATQPPGTPRRKGVRQIGKPDTGERVLVNNYDKDAQTGTIVVECEVDEPLAVNVVGWIKGEPTAFAVPLHVDDFTMLPDGGFALTQDGMSSTWRKNDAPITGLAPSLPAAGNNRRVFVAGYKANGDKVGDAMDLPFIAMPGVLEVTVSAHRCLWLTYAEGLAIAAFGETTSAADDYLPLALPVPHGAGSVTVVALSGAWRHDPADATETNATGRSGTEQPLDPAHQDKYRNATLRSMHINSANARLNRLVALWKYGDTDRDTDEIDVITTSNFDVPKPVRPTHLCLGFHDGFEWSNNSGAIQVRVTWTAEGIT